MSKIDAIKAQLFRPVVYVAGGHGGWTRGDGMTTVPDGMELCFFQAHNRGLGDDVGGRIESMLAGGDPPYGIHRYTKGQSVHNYRLYRWDAGTIITLRMSSVANQYYISTDDVNGILLSDIMKKCMGYKPAVILYWAACRTVLGGRGFGAI
jgi:hypothetical protein